MDKPICQSCGMPMDDNHHGTNEDGSKSEEYCSYCYMNGAFTDEGISLEEKIQKNVELSLQMGATEEEARKQAMEIVPKLKRWRGSD